MKIFSSDKKSHITLEIDASDASIYPIVNLFVSVNDRGFCGRHDVWLKREELHAFLVDLRQCEITRQGKAVLSTSDGLELTFSQRDGWGHFRIDYTLWRHSFEATHLLEGGFAFDVEMFAQTVAALDALLQGMV